MTRRDVRIATVYRRTPMRRSDVRAMDSLRWLRISEGLADIGFSVDMIVDTSDALGTSRAGLRYVSPAAVDWSSYHVVKTLYLEGFRTLMDTGGGAHPFILARIGAVVGPSDDIPGVYFFGKERETRWEAQQVGAGAGSVRSACSPRQAARSGRRTRSDTSPSFWSRPASTVRSRRRDATRSPVPRSETPCTSATSTATASAS